MDLTFLIIFGIILAAALFLIWNKLSALSQPKTDEKDKLFLMLNENLNAVTKQMMAQLNDVRRQIDLRLKENAEILQKSNKAIGERLDGASKAVTDVKSHLTRLDEANKRIYDIGKDISTLQEVLKSPKLRGGLGELSLENLLSDLPREMYETQYSFKDGKKVDAIIRFKDHIVPIDAKFSLENFQKFLTIQDEREKKAAKKAFSSDVKKRIDETASYIKPDEGTLDFALMYIPAENVYYEIIVRDENQSSIDEYARKKHVIPVSPNNFFAYLKTILIGFKGMQIERSAREIQMTLGRLKHDFASFSEDFSVLGSHLANAKNKFEQSERTLSKLTDRLENIELIGSEKEQQKLIESVK